MFGLMIVAVVCWGLGTDVALRCGVCYAKRLVAQEPWLRPALFAKTPTMVHLPNPLEYTIFFGVWGILIVAALIGFL